MIKLVWVDSEKDICIEHEDIDIIEKYGDDAFHIVVYPTLSNVETLLMLSSYLLNSYTLEHCDD